jgi:RES domain-containing protein
VKYTSRGGMYFRVADQTWKDPLDPRCSKETGGRWNPPGQIPVLYLAATIGVAGQFARQHVRGIGVRLENVRSGKRPDLCEVEVPRADFVDAVSDDGCIEVGLPAAYPAGYYGETGWPPCQEIGLRVWSAGAQGIAVRSAIPGVWPAGEELAWYDQPGTRRPRLKSRRAFGKWFV